MNGRPFGSGLRRTAQTAAGKSAFRRFFAVSELFFTVFELFFHNRHAAFSPPRLRGKFFYHSSSAASMTTACTVKFCCMYGS